MPLGVENLVLVSDETRKQVYEAARHPPDATPKHLQDATDGPATAAKKERQWRIGGVEFEALMRMLDNAVSTITSLFSLLKHNLAFLHSTWFVHRWAFVEIIKTFSLMLFSLLNVVVIYLYPYWNSTFR
jgi:hypothetical protein